MPSYITFKAVYETNEHKYTHILNLHPLLIITPSDYDAKLKLEWRDKITLLGVEIIKEIHFLSYIYKF